MAGTPDIGGEPPRVALLESRRLRPNRKISVPGPACKAVTTQVYQGDGVLWHENGKEGHIAIANTVGGIKPGYAYRTQSVWLTDEKKNGDRDLRIPQALDLGKGLPDVVYFLATDEMLQGKKRWVNLMAPTALHEVVSVHL